MLRREDEINLKKLRTPYFLIDEERIRYNLAILEGVQKRTGCKILLAQKAFSTFSCYPLLSSCLAGSTASGLYEARLGKEYFGKETHVFSPAYRDDEFAELLQVSDHIVFNSVRQLLRFGARAKAAGKSIGLRINPECSTQEGHAIYDPCAPLSRLGVTLENLEAAMEEDPAGEGVYSESILSMLDGFHIHTLCEQNSDALLVTAQAFEEKFGKYLSGMKWINFGGGHHITREDYDLETLESVICHFRDKYCIQVYLEPGEAVVLNAGYLVSSVLEIVKNGREIAILDASAACHMPDVLEMPYRPPVRGSGEPEEKPFFYRLAGPTCLAGDVMGDYSFDKELKEGDLVIFEDMALYTMVKTNTFNGMRLPDISLLKPDGKVEQIRSFGYEDFKNRLS
ncbi:MAG: carboxynorspermidine decarboxylase [Blautia sp.]|nr:carboxynorspermidine decarboxylase [Blautia sp.]